MSILTHVIICDPVEIGEPVANEIWAPRSSRLEYNGVDNVLLATLWRTLNEGETAASLEGTDLVVWPNAMPMVFRLPDDLTNRLAALDVGQVKSTALRFAKQASTEGKPLALAMYF